jgi:hypothetical protein
MMREKDAVVLFHIPFELKDKLVSEARERKLSVTKLINRFIVESLKKKTITTGRGHIDIDAIEKTKAFLRKKHPKPVRIIDVANHVGVQQARAARLLDILSGGCSENTNSETDFLIYCNDDEKPVTFSIFIDRETEIYADENARN